MRKCKKIEQSIMMLLMFLFVGCGGNTEERVIPNSSSDSSHSTTTVRLSPSQFINRGQCDQIIDKEYITICYDYTRKSAKAVSYVLDGDLMYDDSDIEKRPSFYSEKSIDKKYRVVTSDYTHSGYDRGHLAPDASFDWSQESLEAVYSLANIIPQAPQVNRNRWVKVEKFARDKAVEFGALSVINVIKFSKNSKKIGKNKMSVSKGFYKVLSNENSKYQECFYYSNRLSVSSNGDTVNGHRVSCDEVGY